MDCMKLFKNKYSALYSMQQLTSVDFHKKSQLPFFHCSSSPVNYANFRFIPLSSDNNDDDAIHPSGEISSLSATLLSGWKTRKCFRHFIVYSIISENLYCYIDCYCGIFAIAWIFVTFTKRTWQKGGPGWITINVTSTANDHKHKERRRCDASLSRYINHRLFFLFN